MRHSNTIASQIAIEAVHTKRNTEFHEWNTVQHVVLVDRSMYRRETYLDRKTNRVKDSGWVRRGTLHRDYHQFVNTMLDMGYVVGKGPKFNELVHGKEDQEIA